MAETEVDRLLRKNDEMDNILNVCREILKDPSKFTHIIIIADVGGDTTPEGSQFGFDYAYEIAGVLESYKQDIFESSRQEEE